MLKLGASQLNNVLANRALTQTFIAWISRFEMKRLASHASGDCFFDLFIYDVRTLMQSNRD